MNILIAENDKNTRDTIKNIIRCSIDDTIEIFEAENAQDALDALHENSIDILITDVVMPAKSGFELIEEVRTDMKFKDLFIVAITGLNSVEEIEKLFLYGADCYISKPINKVEIISRLKLIIKVISSAKKTPLSVRDAFNPFNVSGIMSYYTVFRILLEEDLYQIVHYVISLFPKVNKAMLKEFITTLLKSYELIKSELDQAFEIMLESSYDAVYLTCTNTKFIQALMKNENYIPTAYELRHMSNSMTIKIPIDSME